MQSLSNVVSKKPLKAPPDRLWPQHCCQCWQTFTDHKAWLDVHGRARTKLHLVRHVGIPLPDMLAKAATFMRDPEIAARFVCLPLVQLSYRYQVLMEEIDFNDLDELKDKPLRMP